MEKELFINIQNKLKKADIFNNIDEDWGQLENYDNNIPSKFPCALIDIENIDYTTMAKDIYSKKNKQIANVKIIISITTLKLTNSSLNTPLEQKEKNFEILDLIDKSHNLLQNFKPAKGSNNMNRINTKKVKHKNGLQEYQLTYTNTIFLQE